MISFCLLLVNLLLAIGAAERIELNSNWQLCKEIYAPGCIEAVVPGTILTSLLKNGTFSDIGVDLDNVYLDNKLSLLPDIAQTGSEFFTYHYVTKVSVPCPADTGTGTDTGDNSGRWVLRLEGFNYRAQVYAGPGYSSRLSLSTLEGELEEEGRDAIGMFRSAEFEIPDSVVEHCDEDDRCSIQLAIKVLPPDFPGDASNGGQGGDHAIARNGPVTQFSCGWDWIQATPDRHTGLYDKVVLERRGAIELSNPFVIAGLSGLDFDVKDGAVDVDVNSSKRTARVSVEVGVRASVAGKVMLDLVDAQGQVVASAFSSIEPTNGHVVPTSISFTLDNVRLWWPHTLGDPYLYTVQLSSTQGVPLSFQYGFRHVKGYLNDATQGWAFKVNGVDTFLQGGNWITTDQLLRFAADSDRYSAEVEMHRDMGMNLIRVWGGGVAERDPFYEAADRLGMLVWQEFWMTGDNNGRWGGEYEFPDDDSVYIANARSTIIRLRNHASLLLYCGGNELNPKDVNPKPSILAGLQQALHSLDPHRFFTISSMAPQATDPAGWDPSYSLGNNDGPYGLLYDAMFYDQRNPGMIGFQETPQSINPEVGSVGTPEYESLQRFLSPDALAQFPTRLSGDVNAMWEYHLYEGYTTVSDGETGPDPTPSDTDYDHIYDSFGGTTPKDSDEYSWRAQIVMYNQFKSLFEGFSAHSWEWYSGVLFWKSQTPWPALRGGLYDYYLRQTGGFWGIREALNDPVHVQLASPRSSAVLVVNKAGRTQGQLFLTATTYAEDGSILVDLSANVTAGAVHATSVYQVPVMGDLWPNQKMAPNQGMLFVRLALYSLQDDGSSTLLSSNTYSGSPSTPIDASSTPTVDYNGARTSSAVVSASAVAAADGHVTATISLPASSAVAFMVRLTAVKAGASAGMGEDRRVLPTFYSGNYLTILPGETVTVQVTSPLGLLPGEVVLEVDGWNSAMQQVAIVKE